VLDAATRLFAERGYAGTSVREVAEAAGCTKPALYYYYPSKEELFLRAIGAKVTQLAGTLDDISHREGAVRDRLRDSVAALVDFARADPSGLMLLYRASQRPEEGQPSFDFGPVHDQPLANVRAMLDEGVARGEIRGDVDVDDALLALRGMVDLKCCALIFGGASIPEDFPERAIALLFDGVRP
jgi:AcrR family transcriptional regulator